MNRKASRSTLLRSALLATASAVLAAQAHASGPQAGPIVVGDFGLIDHRGAQQQLSRLGNHKAVVIISQANSCQDNIEQLPKYKLLRTLWEKKGIGFLMLNADNKDNLDAIRRVASVFDIDFPIMKDETQLVAENLRSSSCIQSRAASCIADRSTGRAVAAATMTARAARSASRLRSSSQACCRRLSPAKRSRRRSRSRTRAAALTSSRRRRCTRRRHPTTRRTSRRF
jgi:hypothetical protein